MSEVSKELIELHDIIHKAGDEYRQDVFDKAGNTSITAGFHAGAAWMYHYFSAKHEDEWFVHETGGNVEDVYGTTEKSS